MNHASLKSARLQRALKVLSDGKPHSTLELLRRAKLAAVSPVIAELRCLGARIECKCSFEGPEKARRYYYTMTRGPRENG